MIQAALLLPPVADFAVIHAKIWTDGHLQKANCVASRNGQIVFVGVRAIGAFSLTKNANVVDAKGAVVIPGLIDSHIHMIEGGIGLNKYVDLRPATSKEDFIRRVREFASKLSPGQWVLGRGWSAESWPGRPQPTKEWIDEATGGRPAMLSRMDGHSALVNSAALKLSKIDTHGPGDPKGGVIDRDPTTHQPTGMLRDAALSFLRTPDDSAEDEYQGFVAAVKEANRQGITAVSDIEDGSANAVYKRFFSKPNPTMRVGFYCNYPMVWEGVYQSLLSTPPVPGWLRPNGIKAYMDGSLGSRTAYMHEPFTKLLPNQPKTWRGSPRIGATNGMYAKKFPEAADRSYQLITHAIGDQANHDVLDLYEAIPGHKGKRFRVEHAQHLLPTDIARFGELGVIASMQPYHKADDGRYAEEIIGTERCRSSYAYRDILKTGGTLAFGSDWPVVSNNPWLGIATAVTGKIVTGKVWMPHQNITLDQALDAYTRAGAYAMFMENSIGRLAVGYKADLVILDRDPFDKSTNLSQVKPKSVFVNGVRAYRS